MPDAATPIYDALYAHWRANFRTVPGERGPDDHWNIPTFRDSTTAGPLPQNAGRGLLPATPRQLFGYGTRVGAPVPASPLALQPSGW